MSMKTIASILLAAASPTVASSQRPASAPSAAMPEVRQAPGYFRLRIGRLLVTVLTDGTATVPFDTLLKASSQAQVLKAFADAGAKPSRPTSINAFLIDTGSRLILIDAGAGGLFGPCCGRLPESLAAAGYRPEQIDDVLLTHVHGDHSGGLVANGRRVFPKAQLHLAKAELAFWTSDAERARAQTKHQKMFAEGRAALAPYVAAHRVRTFDGRTEVFPGIVAIPAPGHTPGHTFYEIADEGHRLLIVGDTIHAAEVQLPDPSVTVEYDIDPSAARARRISLLPQLASSHELIAGDHLSFPGIGHIAREGSGFAFVPLPYSADVAEVGD